MDQRLAATLGAHARAARRRAGLTQADVAERIGITPEVYGRIERGQVLPSVPTLIKLCAALSASADELLGLSRELGVAWATEPGPRYREPGELRALVRHARRLEARQIRLLGALAAQLSRSRSRGRQ